MAHYVDEDRNFKNALFEFEKLKDSCSETIAERTRQLLEEYSIEPVLISTDDANNMRGAFQDERDQVYLEERGSSEVDNYASVDEYLEEVAEDDLEDDSIDELKEENYEEQVEPDNISEGKGLNRLHCFAHVLNRAVEYAKLQSRELGTILTKYQGLENLISTKKELREAFLGAQQNESPPLRLIKLSNTRWNSISTAFHRLQNDDIIRGISAVEEKIEDSDSKLCTRLRSKRRKWTFSR